MTDSIHYQVTIMIPSWILKSYTQKISQNYVIVLTKFRRESTMPPDMIFFYYILIDNKIGKEGEHP